MKHFTIIAIVWSIWSTAVAGGPWIEAKSLDVEKVITTKHQIIAKVSGKLISHSSVPNKEFNVDGAILRIPKMFWTHPGGDEFIVAKDWNKYCKEFLALEGKKVFFQMWKTRMILDGATLTEIVADQVKFGAHQEE